MSLQETLSSEKKTTKGLLKIPTPYAIQTGNTFFDYENPETSTMGIEDVAHALSNICRWGGHCEPFFSVAQHAVLVADIAQEEFGDEYITYVALHHDDHEAVRGDIPSPRKRFLKKHRQNFITEEHATDSYIYSTLLGLEWPFPENVKAAVRYADMVALMTERQFLKPKAIWHDEEPAKNHKPLSEEFFSDYLKRRDWKKVYLAAHNSLKEIIDV